MSEENVSQVAPTRDDRLIAALAHALVLASWLGPIGAAVIYAFSRDRHRHVAFEAAQAAVYQLLVVVATILAWSCWTGLYLLSMVPMITHPAAYPEPPWFFWVGMASMLLPFALTAVMTVYGLWGAVRCLQGRRFRYAIVGRWLEHFLGPREESC